MFTLYQTESGLVTCKKAGSAIQLKYKNIGLQFSLRSFRKLHQYLSELDPNKDLFNTEAQIFEVTFSSHPLTLHFNYYEILEFQELVEEGLAEWEFRNMIQDVGLSISSNPQF